MDRLQRSSTFAGSNARIGYRLTDHFIAALTAQQFNVSRIVQAAGPPVAADHRQCDGAVLMGPARV
jgi:hypothetical protein